MKYTLIHDAHAARRAAQTEARESV